MKLWMTSCGVVIVTSFLLGGCSGAEPDASVLEQAAIAVETPAPEVWIKVDKTERRLWLYQGEAVIREYPVVLGGDPYWAKLHEGDKRTPEGEYHIIKKYPHAFWSKFMLLDYPNALNAEVYDWSRAHGALPSDQPGIGGAIGIHGAEDESKNRRGINWTLGCISLFNKDVDELYELVPVGTRVLIQR